MKSKKFVSSVLVSLLVLVVSFVYLSCDSDDSSTSGESLTQEELAEGYVRAFCKKALSCCQDGIDLGQGGAITSEEECVSGFVGQYLKQQILNDLNDPKVIYHEEYAGSCLDEINSLFDEMSCDEGLGEDPAKELEACGKTVEGTVEVGGACDKDVQCQGANHCVNGKCVVPKEEGESCTMDAECKSYNCEGGTCAPTQSSDDSWNEMCYEEGAQG